MSGSHPDPLSHSHLLSQLHPQCQNRHGNLSNFLTTPSLESSTGDQGEEEDTDFGAVLYIAAVLVFYSLGIVVMIVKYLKTERKELEEEMALESFFKGIPSKKMEHNRDAVNRVAIRAFHTLTSGAKQQNQLQVGAERTNPTTPDTDGGPTIQDSKSGTSPHSDDSDSSRGDFSPYLLQREPSKYLPRVSLIFRDNRANDRRRTYDNIRCKSSLFHTEKSLPSGHRSLSTASAPLHENGQPGLCLRAPNEHSDHGGSFLASPRLNVSERKGRTDGRGHRSQPPTVKFVDENKPWVKPASRSRSKSRAKNAKSSSQGHPKTKPAIKFSLDVDWKPGDCSTSSTPPGHGVLKENSSEDRSTSPTYPEGGLPKSDSSSRVGNGSVSPVDCPGSGVGTSMQVTVSGEQDDVVSTVVTQQPGQQSLQPSRGLLVSDV